MFLDLTKLQGPTKSSYANGVDIYMEGGVLHRADGPAISTPNHQEWFVKGVRHRENGPAIVYKFHPAPRGDEAIAAGGKNICEWYVNGEYTYQAIVSDDILERHWHKDGK